jgi:hypothetical protein
MLHRQMGRGPFIMLRHRFAFLATIALGTLPVAPGFAADQPETSPQSSIADRFRAAGAATARESKELGAAVKEGAKRVGAATRKMSHQVADASVKGAHEVRDAAKGVAAKTKNAVKRESSHRNEQPAP